jgi:hypothetical protein
MYLEETCNPIGRSCNYGMNRINMQQHMSSSFRVCVCVYIAVSVWREKREKELKGGPTCLIE